jgi:hypothetical protein
MRRLALRLTLAAVPTATYFAYLANQAQAAHARLRYR